jgi:hypothetical protein
VKKIAGIAIGICLQTAAINAQDLSGFWKGSFNMQGCFPNNNIELQVSMKDGIATGDSYHYQDIDNYVKKKFSGQYDPSQKKLLLQEGLVTTYHIPRRCVICIKQFNLFYSKVGNLEILRGLWTGNVLNMNSPCGTDSIILTRIRESAFKEIPEIKVDTGSIRLDFYDNAIVDGDSITVLVDNQVVFSHQRLTEKPLTTFVRVDLDSPFHEVEMIAENLGSIPPNTAILIITAGENRHQLTLNSTETKSAKVRFVYEAKDGNAPVPPKYSMR